MQRLPAILREPSTWRGLGLALSLAGITAGPILTDAVGTAVIAGLAAWEVIRKELRQ